MSRPVTSRPLLLAGPAAVAGVLLAALWPAWPALAGAAGLSAAAWAVARRSAPAAVVVAALLGGSVAGTRLRLRTDAALAAHAPQWPRAPPRTAVARLEVIRCDEDPFRGRAWLQGRDRQGLGVLCTWSGALPAGVAPGARVRVTGRFYVPGPSRNPGEVDRRRALAESGVVLRAELRRADNVEVLEAAPDGIGPRLAAARRRAAVRLRRALPEDVAPLATALLLGLRSGIADEDRRLFERTGTMHILAISGMHVLLLAGLVHSLLRRAGVGPRAAAAVTLALALLYVPLTGAAAPIRRAVAVLAFYALALVRGRPPDSGSALGGAALLLALTDPAEVFRVGFRLSFAAAAGIAWLAAGWRERWSRRHRLLRRFPAVREDRPLRLLLWGYAWRALPVSLAAWCATQGMVAQAFGVVTPLAPLVNLVVGPWLALLLPLIALVALGADAAAGLVTLSLRGLRTTLEVAAAVPGGFWLVVPPPLWTVALWTAGGLLLRSRPRRGLALLLLAALCVRGEQRVAVPRLDLLDVGHGQAALLRHPDGGAVLVDAGSRTRPGLARRVLVPALRALGVTRLDAIICTHRDVDHWNAAPELLGVMPVGRLIVGDEGPRALIAAARRRGVPLARVRAGDEVPAGAGIRLTVLAGDGGKNNRALALVWEVGGCRVLLPADREEAGLAELLARGAGTYDVLVAPHHGARCETAYAFGVDVRPRLLLVSASRGFPDPETLAAYGAARLLDTARYGCITVRFPGAGRLRTKTWLPMARATIRPP